MNKKNNYSAIDSSKVFLWAVFFPQILSIIFVMVLAIFFKDIKELETSIVYAVCMEHFVGFYESRIFVVSVFGVGIFR